MKERIEIIMRIEIQIRIKIKIRIKIDIIKERRTKISKR